MSQKSFTEFQASKVRVSGDNRVLEINQLSDGFVYDGDCVIGILSDGQYHLIIGCDEYTSDNLAELEEILFRDWYLRSCC